MIYLEDEHRKEIAALEAHAKAARAEGFAAGVEAAACQQDDASHRQIDADWSAALKDAAMNIRSLQPDDSLVVVKREDLESMRQEIRHRPGRAMAVLATLDSMLEGAKR